MLVSRGIVKAHGGETGLFSAGEGKGSNFFFGLPLYIVSLDEEATHDGGVSSQEEPQKEAAKPADQATMKERLKVFSGLRVLVVNTCLRLYFIMFMKTIMCVLSKYGMRCCCLLPIILRWMTQLWCAKCL